MRRIHEATKNAQARDTLEAFLQLFHIFIHFQPLILHRILSSTPIRSQTHQHCHGVSLVLAVSHRIG